LFLKNYNKLTLNDLSTKVNNLIVISSLSKIFSIGGIRLGFCVSSRKNISLIKKNMNPYSVNVFAQKLLPNLIKAKGYLSETKNFVAKEKLRVYENLTKINGIKTFEPKANFIIFKIINQRVAPDELFNYLNKALIKVREGNIFPALSDRFVRFSIKTRRENDLLLKKLKIFFQKKRYDK